MSEAIRWWLILLVVGAVTLPLCLAMFRRLPDRGYSLSKPFALIFVGFTFWFLNSMHILPNHRGGIIAAMLLLAVVAAAFAWRDRDDLMAWAERNWGYVVSMEAAFLFVFMIAVWLRSFVGTIEFTEQPMDLMFVNAAAQADFYPPEDPWLSGHNVAYYYFGYVIVAMIGTLAGVPVEIGYNLGLAMIAALTLLAAFGIVYNLIIRRGDDNEPPDEGAPFDWRPVMFGAAGAIFVVVLSNWTWVLKFMSAYGIGSAGFYDWFEVQGITADEPRNGWYPSDFFGFFDGSRVYPLNNTGGYVITEWPMFSFVLGDLHPHVMALPFVLLVIGFALTLYRSDEPLDVAFLLQRPALFLGGAIMLGALGFINTWDTATMAFVVGMSVLVVNGLQVFRAERSAAVPNNAAATFPYEPFVIVAAIHLVLTGLIIGVLAPAPLMTTALIAVNVIWIAAWGAYLKSDSWHPVVETVVRTISFVFPLVLLSVALYLPFYDSFSSQADGFLPVVTNDGVSVPGTRPVSALLVWGPLFAIVVPFVAVRLAQNASRITLDLVLRAAAVPVAIVVGWALLFGYQATIGDHEDLRTADNLILQMLDRGIGWITAVLLGGVLAAALLAFWLELTSDEDSGDRRSTIFALGLACTAFLLILGTEFYYIGDLFSDRMNTVFKLYYQAWVLLALAGGLAFYTLCSDWRFSFRNEQRWRYAWGAAAAIAIAGGALYPLGATWNRTEDFERQGQLRGLHNYAPGDREAVAWLQSLGKGQDIVIAEAVQDDYWVTGEWSRISAATGVPTVLGWEGHENQWRGAGSTAQLGRKADVTLLYGQADEAQVRQIVDKYAITYIYVGDLERTTYGTDAVSKFETLPIAFRSQDGSVTVYKAQGTGAEAEVSTAP